MKNSINQRRLLVFIALYFATTLYTSAQVRSDPWLEKLLRENATPLLQRVLDNPDSFQYQLIYTQIDRDRNNMPSFKHYYLNVDRDRYFYPASTAKLPTALLALEKLNTLKVPGLDKYCTMLTDSAYSGQTKVMMDSSARDLNPSMAHYIRKIFIVSDNDAYNRLYEFVGQGYLNEKLKEKGYEGVRITHRFVRLTANENRHTNPVRFFKNGKLIYSQPAVYSTLQFDTTKRIYVGHRYVDKDEKIVNMPMDFTMRNRFPLQEIQQMLQAVLFPSSVPEKKRFYLSPDDERWVMRAMSELPWESRYPLYDTAEFFESYTKFFFFRANKSQIPPSIRSFNKAGWSYGFLTDVAYIVDLEHNVEFMLSGVIYVNSDGTLNDDNYEYETIGYPFFKSVGERVYQYELKRKRKHTPNLERFRFDYGHTNLGTN